MASPAEIFGLGNAPLAEMQETLFQAAFQDCQDSNLRRIHLLSAGFDLAGLVNRVGHTLLTHALHTGDRAAATCLIQAKLLIDTADGEGNTPLSVARRLQNSHAVRELVAAGVNISCLFEMTREPIPLLPNFYDHPPENLVFKGGGPRGVAYVGALRALDQALSHYCDPKSPSLFPYVKRVAGTSAGAIASVFLAFNSTLDELEQQCATNFLRLLDPSRRALSGGGLCEGRAFRDWIDQAIEVKCKIKNCTFGELRTFITQGRPYKHLYVFATRISGGPTEVVEWSSEDPQYDRVVIADAVRASMSIPGIFQPHMIAIKNAHGASQEEATLGRFVDGGLIYNFPIDAFDQRRYLDVHTPQDERDFPTFNPRTLGFSFQVPRRELPLLLPETPPSSGLLSMATNFLKTSAKTLGGGLLEFYTNIEEIRLQRSPYNQHRVIEIDPQGVGLLDFNLSLDNKRRLVDAGIQATRTFLTEHRNRSRSIPH